MGAQATNDTKVRERFRTEVRRNTRTTGIVAGVVAIIGFPGWAAFDWLVAPDKAPEFTVIRVFATIPIALLWGAMLTEWGKRRPELLVLGMLSVVQVAIAVMIARIDANHAAYALGFSTALFGCAFLLIWPPRYSAALVGVSLGALAVSWIVLGEGATAEEIATVAFFAGTSSVIAIAGQAIRERASYRDFATRLELEREQERSQRLVAELEMLSREDPLTGLLNRRAWDEALRLECARAERGVSSFAVLLCDIDQLKAINDGLGHAVGDAAIKAVAERIAARVRGTDLAARIGGDEFAIMLPGSTLAAAAEFAEELREQIATIESAGEGPGVRRQARDLDRITISIGVAEWGGAGDGTTALMLRADRRLYAAKGRRNSVATEVDIAAA